MTIRSESFDSPMKSVLPAVLVALAIVLIGLMADDPAVRWSSWGVAAGLLVVLFSLSFRSRQTPDMLSASSVPTSEPPANVDDLCRDIQKLRARNNAMTAEYQKLEARMIKAVAAKSEAERLCQSRGGFIANMSHELRSPLTAILGFTDVLIENEHEPDDAMDRARLLKIIQRNSQNLLELINEVLDFSKIESGKLVIEKRTVELRTLFDDMEASYRSRFNQKKVDFEVDYKGLLPEFFESDPLRLKQIINNLLSNSLKFTERGSVRLIVELDRSDPDEPMLRISVEDTGIGMSPATQARLFEPYQQEAGIVGKYGGTGLGLAITRQLVQGLGGSINFESDLGAGSTFTVLVPTGSLVGAVLADRSQSEEAEEPSVMPAAENINARVLLAEDSPDNQRLIEFFLRRMGIEVDIAEDGAQAVRNVEKVIHGGECYDLILMDMQMPIMDGYDATRAIRKLGYEVPIIALTAHALEGDREKCLDAGCTDYITKPINPAGFTRTISEVLQAPVAAG